MPDPVAVVPYDPAWPQRFEAEGALLGRVFQGTRFQIEHVGSTAVPGLGAKPILDILVGLESLGDAERRIPALEAAGYEYVPAYESQLPERRYFRKPRDGPRAYHLHCVLHGSDFWVRHLAFRDYLRAHPDAVAEYFALKKELAARYRDDKVAYTEAKSPFIEGILRRAPGGRVIGAGRMSR